jgi:hypothetical protein
LISVKYYIAELDRTFRLGDATEHSHRPALQALLQSYAGNIVATNEPQQIAGNAPDYVVRRGPAIIGHVEAKDIDEPLDKLLKSPQLKRYREALPNLLLTDYLDFIWLEGGEVKLRARLGEVTGRGIVAAADADAQWQRVSLAFFNAVTPTVRTPKQLAHLLAAQTRLLRDVTIDTLRAEGEGGSLSAQHRAFRELLVPELTPAEFADMFAQTVAYGLFTARVFDTTPLDFSLTEAERLIPKANPFLRQFFHYVAFDLSPGVEWIVQGIVDVLRHADLDAVLHRQGRKRGFEDPVFHFYETFLAEYDPKLRESRGVYYTPEPVVDFIVRGVEHLLKTDFGRVNGLADPDTVILDPATGTATFLRQVIQTIYAHQQDAGLGGMWPDYVRRHLLPRLFGFEIMMAPYTVAHLKLALLLADRGFEFADGDRLNVYLTNTLDRIQGKTGQMMAQWLTQESEGAERVKDSVPVEVVIGNPPYSGESRNKSKWITQLMELYKREPNGGKLQEKNSKWINADEIKFIRFAHWRIEQTGHGIVAYIASHTWLEGPIFRGMRAALLRDFDDIYILDLHGNSNKKEVTPDVHTEHGDDQNVFDIQQGVAILFLVRRPGEHQRQAVVRHAEFWGSRESKYRRLEDISIDAVDWSVLDPPLPQLPFVPLNRDAWAEYERGWSIPKIFTLNGTGIVTKCDQLNIHWTEGEAWQAIRWFASATEEMARARFRLPKPEVRDWKFADAQKDALAPDNKKNVGPHQDLIRPILYRPFDTRYTYYTGQSRGVMGWPVERVMRHLFDGENVALITARSNKSQDQDHFFVSDKPTETKAGESTTQSATFPLWLLPDAATPVRHPNIDPRFLKALADALGVEVSDPFGLPDGVSAEDVFHYVYAVLHAPTYRSRYTQYLRSDFPRIPLPIDAKLFRALAVLGAQLVDLHLLRDPALAQGGPAYPVGGDNKVEKVLYTPPKDASFGRVWINPRQYFDGISPDEWAFQIGGYQILEKWLKDRKGRTLDSDDVDHYRKIVLALAGTARLMAQIDEVGAPLFPAMAVPEPA